MKKKSISLFSYLRKLWPLFTRPQRLLFFLLVFIAVFLGLFEIVLTGLVGLFAAVCASSDSITSHPRLAPLGKIFNGALLEDPRYLAFGILTLLFLAITFRHALYIFHRRLLTGLTESIAGAVRRRILLFYLRVPYAWIMQRSMPEILFGLNVGAKVGDGLVKIMLIVNSLLSLATLMVVLIAASPTVSIGFFLFVSAGGYAIVRAVRHYIDVSAKADLEASQSMNKVQNMAVNALREIRLSGRGQALLSTYDEHLGAQRQAVQRSKSLLRLPSYSFEAFGFLVLAGVMGYLVLVENANMTRITGTMGLLAAASWRALPIASMLVTHLTSIRQLLPQWDKVLELLDTDKLFAGRMLPIPSGTETALPFTQSIRLENVTFRYGDGRRDILSDFSLHIAKGEMVGVVGVSGAGKSTLVNVITGLIPPTSGVLKVDDVAIDNANLQSWLLNIACVTQPSYIMDASLLENIAMNRWGDEIDRERALECCRMAAIDFLDDLPSGLDSRPGERGVRLSGGQRQRVAIARALYGDPALLIFDEATSALDGETERAIHEIISSLHGLVTTIIIAHRLTTLVNCDKILWLAGGNIKKMGAPEEVLPEYQGR